MYFLSINKFLFWNIKLVSGGCKDEGDKIAPFIKEGVVINQICL